MQCFICVTYMIVLYGASPSGTREITTTHEKRSLFRDVIESLRIRAQLPEDIDHNDDNNLAQNYEIYDNEPSYMPSDTDYIPRRNDRIELPPMKYRFPKSVDINESNIIGTAKPQHEVVLYIDDPTESTTQKPKNDKRPKPNKNKVQNKNIENEDNAETEAQTDNVPFTNNMAGQSQIGNRESQTVVKPTVIVNIRGSVNHKDGEIKLHRNRDNTTRFYTPLNVFNINQDVRVQKEAIGKGLRSESEHEGKLLADTYPKDGKEIVFETATWGSQNNQDDRKSDNVLQILLSL